MAVFCFLANFACLSPALLAVKDVAWVRKSQKPAAKWTKNLRKSREERQIRPLAIPSRIQCAPLFLWPGHAPCHGRNFRKVKSCGGPMKRLICIVIVVTLSAFASAQEPVKAGDQERMFFPRTPFGATPSLILPEPTT